MDTIRVIVAVADSEQREALINFINLTTENIKVIGAAYDESSIWKVVGINQHDLHVLILDTTSIDSLKIISDIREDLPAEIKILAITENNSSSLIDSLNQAGISGHILKRQLYKKLINMISTVHQDNSLIHTVPRSASGIKLTKEERKTLDLIAQGFDRDTIAQKVSRKPSTIETHYQNLLAKLKAGNVNELLDIAKEKGFLE